MITLLNVLIGAIIGGAVVWVILARQRVKKVMFEEIERDGRFSMRQFLGHAFPKFGEKIRTISPEFCAVYQQAADAESYGLNQVCGVGYGKALEFLIKDYAKHENPNARAEIERASLSRCIERFISDDGIRNSSDVARWLRNDETHYLRKYAQADIGNLKRLIALTVALIENAEQKRALERQTGEEKKRLNEPSDPSGGE